MKTYIQFIFLISAILSLCIGKEIGALKRLPRKFPKDFIFGASTSAHQIEGAWNEDGKGMSIWDDLEHSRPGFIEDGSTAAVACDSYHQYKRDVEMLKEINAKMYRFSISWPRILPYGLANYTNQAGIDYYNNLIDELIANDIEPMVTIFHWDLPVYFQQLGGFANPFIATWFADYARVLFENFGDRVKHWITLNESFNICYSGYAFQVAAPLIAGSGTADYMCVRNVLMSHAKAFHLYDEEFRDYQGGKVGITDFNLNTYPASDSEDDKLAAQIAHEFYTGVFSNPIFSETGDYPELVKQIVAENSAKEGFPRSRLVELTEEEVDYIQGTYDFMGVNVYTSWYLFRNSSLDGVFAVTSFDNDAYIGNFPDPKWEQSSLWYNYNDPNCTYLLLKYITEKYGNHIELYITESGWSSETGLDDDDRVRYFKNQIGGTQLAIQEGANVKAYLAWSLMDNFEWGGGYTKQLGLYHVDFEDPNRTRTPKKSAFYLKEVAKTLVFDPDFEPVRS